MKKFITLLCCLGSLCGQENCLQGSSSHADFGYQGPGGVGYDDGYSTVDLFLTPNWQRGFQPILDGRVHLLNDGRWASNLGGAMRWQMPANCAFGSNFFYDFRSAKGLRAHQLGAGIELLHPIFDLTINGYLPIGRTSHVGNPQFDFASGFNIFLKRRITQALPHMESLIGFWTPASWPIDFYWAAGPYYLFREAEEGVKCGKAWGVKTYLELMLIDGLLVGGQYTYDREFQSNFQGYVKLSFPFGPNNIKRGGSRWKRWYPSYECQQRAVKQRLLTGPIRRDEIIPVCQQTQIGIPGPGGGFIPVPPDPVPPSCFFVNNTLAAFGDGSFETPFNNLPAAEAASGPGDCIYVYFGTGDSTNQDTGIVLKQDQVLQGSGKDFYMGATLIFPAQTASDPTITNPGGTGITLADGVTVTGIILEDTTAGSLFGFGVSDFVFQESTIQNIATGPAVSLSNLMGTSFFINNTIQNNIQTSFIDLADGATMSWVGNSVSQPTGTNDVFSISLDSSTFLLDNNSFTGIAPGGNSILTFGVDNSSNPTSIISTGNTWTITGSVGDVLGVFFNSSSGGALSFRSNMDTFISTAAGVANFFVFILDFVGNSQYITNNNSYSNSGALNFLNLAQIFNGTANFQALNSTLVGTTAAENLRYDTFLTGTACVEISGNTVSTIRFSGGGGAVTVEAASVAAVSGANAGATVTTSGTVIFNPLADCVP